MRTSAVSTRFAAATAAVVLSALAAGCGGGGGSSGGVMSPPPIQANLASIQANVFTASCALSGCHAGGAPQQGMNLSDGLTVANTVNVPSAESPTFNRITPGNAVDSYLFMKITGDPRIVGVQMPKGGAALSADKIAAIRDWINAGAAN